MVPLQSDPSIDQPAVDVFQLVDLLEHVLLDGVGESHIVGCKDELHASSKMAHG
jgi:hypothetical protein